MIMMIMQVFQITAGVFIIYVEVKNMSIRIRIEIITPKI